MLLMLLLTLFSRSSQFSHSHFSIIVPFLLRYHKSLSIRLASALEANSRAQQQSSRAGIASLMILLAAAAHVVRVIRNLNVRCGVGSGVTCDV